MGPRRGRGDTDGALTGGRLLGDRAQHRRPGDPLCRGNFTSAGGKANARRIARWNGSSWSALGNGLADGDVRAIAYHAGKVYAGGTFHDAGGHADADFLAVWDGSTWAPFCTSASPGPAFNGTVSALQIVGNTLYVAGSFANAGGNQAADFLAGCDLTTGALTATVANDGDLTGAIYALTADSNGMLYAGGGFINLAGIPEADHVAAYDGSWHAMGTGVDSFVRSLTASGTTVYVGTDSVDVAGIAQADHVARWDGTAWSAVGSSATGTDGWFPASATIDGLRTYGSTVVAVGSFQNADGIATADQVAFFDGSHWRPIGSDGAGNGPMQGHPTAVAVTGGKVYVGGGFTSAGGDTLARWIAAYALRLPDLSIAGAVSGPYRGDNVYSTTGAGETRHVQVHRGHQVTLYVRVQNDGLVPATFTLKGTGQRTGIVARYSIGSTTVTSGVQAGTCTTASIAARGYVVLRVAVVVGKSGATSATLVTTARSQAGTPPDAVRITVSVVG
ncbi:MAG TPA: hypothetical protein VN088_06480 [Nocardioides sp.]|nr:hypothetical protein [Nocardioides sp.]